MNSIKPLLEFDRVSKTYKGMSAPAVDAVSIAVHKGEILTLLGPSGCGKTTVLRLIAGFERPESGRVMVGGRVVAGDRVWVAPEKRGVGMVFQDYALFPHLTVGKNVGFGLKTPSRSKLPERVVSVLDSVGLSGYENRYPHELSGGQQQRVALARALVGEPELVLLDEPLSNLDADLRKHMRTELKDILDRAGATAILVTHDQEDCFALADRVAVLRAGRVEQVGRAEDLYHEPATRFVANFLGIADFLPGTVEPGRIETPVAVFNTDEELPAGTEVDVLIRPDDVELLPRRRGAALIIKRQFKGAEILYTVQIDDRELRSLGPSYGGLPVGQRVNVKVAVDHTVVFPRNGDRRAVKDSRRAPL